MRRYTLQIKGQEYVIDVQELASDRFQVLVGNEEFEVHLKADQDLAQATISPEIVPIRTLEVEHTIERPPAPARPLAPESLRPVPRAPQPALPAKPQLPSDGFRADLRAPMPGTLLSVEVKPGDRVTRGQTVAMLEAMKMKNAIKSPQDAVVAEVLVQPGQTVRHGDVIVRFQEAAA